MKKTTKFGLIGVAIFIILYWIAFFVIMLFAAQTDLSIQQSYSYEIPFYQQILITISIMYAGLPAIFLKSFGPLLGFTLSTLFYGIVGFVLGYFYNWVHKRIF